MSLVPPWRVPPVLKMDLILILWYHVRYISVTSYRMWSFQLSGDYSVIIYICSYADGDKSLLVAACMKYGGKSQLFINAFAKAIELGFLRFLKLHSYYLLSLLYLNLMLIYASILIFTSLWPMHYQSHSVHFVRNTYVIIQFIESYELDMILLFEWYWWYHMLEMDF